MKEILSRQNNEIKAIAKLRTQKGRAEKKQFLAEGFRVCSTISKTIIPDTIYCTPALLEQAKRITTEEKITLISAPVMEKISSAKTPSGIVGVFNIPKAPDITKLKPGIVLAQVTDPGNMGTLIRTTTAMGFKTAVVIEGTDPWGPKVVQASAGQIAKVDIFQISWHTLLQNKKNLKLIGLVVKEGKAPYDIDFTQTLLVIGSEAHGIDPEWVASCEEKLTLPMPGKTESLNAAIAGSIALYLAAETYSK